MDGTGDGLIGANQSDPVLAAHHRLVAGDRVASEELADLLLHPLVTRLKRRWQRWKHSDVLYDAAVDVVLDYIDTPERYDSGDGSLLSWLELAAHRDLINSYQSARQRQAIELAPLSAVADPDHPPGEIPNEVMPIEPARLAPDPANAERLDALGIWRRIRCAFPDERERELIWACWVEGERSSAELARILGVADLPVDQRRRRVKDARDVARRKLKRMGLMSNDVD